MALSLVLALEVAAAITAYVLQDGVVYYLSHKMTSMTEDYNNNPEIAKAVDFMQTMVNPRERTEKSKFSEFRLFIVVFFIASLLRSSRAWRLDIRERPNDKIIVSWLLLPLDL